MHEIVVKSLLVAAGALMVAGAAEAQTSEGSLGNPNEGEAARSVDTPRLKSKRMIPLLKVEPGTARDLPFGDPEALERGFGVVSKRKDGTVDRSEPPADVLDALRKGKVKPDRMEDHGAIDPLFDDLEQARAIVGADNRIQLQNTTSYPFTTIGLLEMDNGSCSGTLVGPRTVITAAHCVYDLESGSFVNEIKFWPGVNGVNHVPYGPYHYEDVSILSGFADNYDGIYGTVVPWDLAVITLQENAGDQLGWLGFSANYATDFRAYNVGYPGDKPYATMWRDKCDVSAFEISDTEYVHRCDTKPGSSGSSMYTFLDDSSGENRYVEGVNVAEVETGDTSTNFNIGVLLTEPYFNWVLSLKK